METPAEQRIVFYNTMTKRKEVFHEREAGKVKMFTCGPSIYRRPHLGNYRTFVFEDVLQRYLEYRGFDVRRMINFTDLEDKAITESEEKSVALEDLTEPNARTFLNDGKLLRLKLPEPIPRSTTSVDQAAELIARLLENGHAYRHEGNVYYDALSHPSFGAVYGLDLSRWPKKRYRFSKDTYPGQRWNLGDFILWHGHREDRYSWETKIGRGRPAWNIQDPAMITKHLGYELDIHCGGIDNVYRHHDYNRAVVEGVTGTEFVHYWLHGEHLFVDSRKMSKSKGNVVYPEHLLSAGRSGVEIRFFLLYGHYRRKGNLTEETLD
ncbi:MAG: class I tRNA ligase family protein, partial [Spirochaetota bacterium]